MRANEIIVEYKNRGEDDTTESIERLHTQDFTGGKETLKRYLGGTKTLQKLPGGSGLSYSVQKVGGGVIIKIWDTVNKKEMSRPKESEPNYYSRLEQWRLERHSPGILVGRLSLSPIRFPLKGAVQVDAITVDEDYRNMGIGKAMYGIVLSILRKPLVAGDSQTPGGRRNWVSLSQIPGVELKGYVSIVDMSEDSFSNRVIDTLMGKLGGQYMGQLSAYGGRTKRKYFAFDVLPNETATELQAHVKTALSKVYTNANDEFEVGSYDSGLYAVWTGK